MSKSAYIIGGGVLGYLGWFLWRKYNAIKNLIFAFGNVSSLDLVGTTPVLTFTIIAQNTSTTDIQVNSFAGNLYANNLLVGNVSNFTPVIIAANSNTAIPVQAQLGLIGIVNDIITAFQTKNAVQNLHIDGAINVLGQQVPIKMDFAVGV